MVHVRVEKLDFKLDYSTTLKANTLKNWIQNGQLTGLKFK